MKYPNSRNYQRLDLSKEQLTTKYCVEQRLPRHHKEGRTKYWIIKIFIISLSIRLPSKDIYTYKDK